MAQDVPYAPIIPDEYVVVKGDTLWDISGRFLDKPWQWPAIWHANPQIENPHLIYPGDVISLVYIDGVPQLRLRRGGRHGQAQPVHPRCGSDDAINAYRSNRSNPLFAIFGCFHPANSKDCPISWPTRMNAHDCNLQRHDLCRGLNARVGEEFVVARLSSIYDIWGSA